MSYVSFQEMKPRVGIDDVAFSLGYKLNRQAGVGRYIELILPDGRGEKLDTIVISHPQEKERQKYFHRNTGKRGDVVDFIGENLGRFNIYGRNQWEVIGKVMADFANMPLIDSHDHGYSGGLGSLNTVFNPKRYTSAFLIGNRASVPTWQDMSCGATVVSRVRQPGRTRLLRYGRLEYTRH